MVYRKPFPMLIRHSIKCMLIGQVQYYSKPFSMHVSSIRHSIQCTCMLIEQVQYYSPIIFNACILNKTQYKP